MIARNDITGLILAGGRGSRMGGVDKGLQTFHGTPMVQHVLQRLAPQTSAVLINANRNVDRYAMFGVPVVADALPDFAGPLAGMLAGLDQCTTRWIVTAPCDTPDLPVDLVDRLARAIETEEAEVAVPVTLDGDGKRRLQPVFCLMPATAGKSLREYVATGQRKIETWVTGLRLAQVLFEDAAAFANINTLDELHRHETTVRPR